jgi:uncharacterized protein YceH (UPF0502 family)
MKTAAIGQALLPSAQTSACRRARANTTRFAQLLADSEKMMQSVPKTVDDFIRQSLPQNTGRCSSRSVSIQSDAAGSIIQDDTKNQDDSFSIDKIVMTLEKQLQEEASAESLRQRKEPDITVVFRRNADVSADRWDRFRMSSAMYGRQNDVGREIFLGLRIPIG